MAERLRDYQQAGVECHGNLDRRLMCGMVLRVTEMDGRGKPVAATCPIHGEIPREYIAEKMAAILVAWQKLKEETCATQS